MNPSIRTTSPVDASPVLPGVGTLTLTRAILRTSFDEDPGAQAEDLGIGVVVSQASQGQVEVLELGSCRLRRFSVDGPVVILGWVLHSTLDRLVSAAEGEDEGLSRMAWALSLRVLEQNGFNAITRTVLLRMGFRDIVRDLDPHEGAAVRLVVEGGGVARIGLDAESTALRIHTGKMARQNALETALQRFFPAADLLAEGVAGASATQAYRLSFRPPESVTECRAWIAGIRRGMLSLIQAMEPRRHQALREQLGVFGERDSLSHLRDGVSSRRFKAVRTSASPQRLGSPGAGRVH